MTKGEDANGNETYSRFWAPLNRGRSTLRPESTVNINKIRASEQLDDHSSGDNRCDSKPRDGTAVNRQNDTHPVQRVASCTI